MYVPLPDDDTRREIFNIHFRKTPTGDDVSIDDLVVKTKGYSGAEVSHFVYFIEAAIFKNKFLSPIPTFCPVRGGVVLYLRW